MHYFYEYFISFEESDAVIEGKDCGKTEATPPRFKMHTCVDLQLEVPEPSERTIQWVCCIKYIKITKLQNHAA